jgi:quercetin dioxygenase-like cupin family protein
MASPGDELRHPVTGERIVWRQVARETDGALLQADLFASPQASPAAPHVHPHQEERFEVLAGRLKVSIDGVETVLVPGDVAIVPPGIPHTWFNVGDAEAHIVVDIRPALRSEMFFETMFGLAADGKTDRRGLPRPLQLAALITEFSDEVRLARPPAVVQRVLFEPLAALGRLRGYRGWYPRYSSNPIDERSNPVRRSSAS